MSDSEDGGYLEGQGDSESRLTMGVARGIMWVIGVIKLRLSSLDPRSMVFGSGFRAKYVSGVFIGAAGL